MFQGKKRIISYVLCTVLLASVWSLGVAFAGDDLQDRLDQVNSEKKDVQAQLNEGKKEAKKLNDQITALENQINAAEKEIGSIQSSISQTKNSIAQAEKNLQAAKEEMVVQNDNMNDRIVAMYKNGDMGMLEVLLGSADVTEFMTNLDMVQRIYDSDIELLQTMQKQYEKIEMQKKELVAMQEQLVKQQQEQEQKQDALEVSRGEVASKKDEVNKNNVALEAQVNAFNQEAANLAAQIRALQNNDATYSGGALGWPVPGVTRTTSEFGYRIHPILKTKKLHTGLDIGAPAGSTVVAAADGTVIMAGWNNSYGNVVMIDHGSGIVTVYAHNTSLLVSKGNTVTRGQAISKSGSTGMSTGPHVHFEVRVNGEYQNPRNYL